jgi:hypothetical protein
MFWNNSGKNLEASPYNKHNFLVEFQNLNSKLAELDGISDRPLTYFAKKVSAPNMKVEFERAYANEYVHYFQNGAIHWEQVTVTFADFNISNARDAASNDINNDGQVTDIEKKGSIASKLSIREIFNYYLQTNLIERFDSFEDINNAELLKNVTSVIELPIFCNKIVISNSIDYAKKDFSTTNRKEINTSKLMYEFYNPRVTSVDFGSFDYSSDDINEITVTFVPQWVVIK